MRYLYNRLPHLLFVLFMLGWCIAGATNNMRRAVLSVAALLILRFSNSFGFNPTVAVGVLVLIWVRSLPVPAVVRTVTAAIASASLFIYLTHFQFQSAAKHIVGRSIPAVNVILALAGGVAVWWIYDRVTRAITSGVLARRHRKVGNTPGAGSELDVASGTITNRL